ncbi:hypothetical protein LWI29_033645 [Acer saccharum]|uniref:Uncharacterized protein n=1 Tax=Acer saccharum TaxID=4024 RepID=A0AA39RFU7_ACESA|nr:hypothetical protein LWI29_033645 [Acer saccharum]
MEISLGFLFCVSLYFSQFFVSSSSHKTQAAFFIIGDSLYDPGNNNFLNVSVSYKADYPPYGETFFKYSTGRFCDGRLIPDFIAHHANLSLWRPYLDQPGKHQFLNGANFASAGATVFPYLSPELLHLDIQLGFFKNVVSLWRHELGNAEANKRLNNAVFLISIGGVDYLFFPSDYPNATESEKQEYVNWVIGNITNTITLNIRIQLGYLKEVANLLKEELGDTEAKNILENAIYLSSFGGVDYMAFINNTYTHFTQSKMEEYVKMVLGNLTEVTKDSKYQTLHIVAPAHIGVPVVEE